MARNTRLSLMATPETYPMTLNTGDAVVTLDDVTLVSAAVSTIDGVVTPGTLADVTLVAVSNIDIAAVCTVTLDDVTLVSTDVPLGDLSVTLDDATLTSVATTEATGDAVTNALEDAILTSLSVMPITGAATVTLDDATAAAAGDTSQESNLITYYYTYLSQSG